MSLARLSSAIRRRRCACSSATASAARLAPIGGVMRHVVLHRAQRATAGGLLAELGGRFDRRRGISDVLICHSTSSAAAELTPRNRCGPARRKLAGNTGPEN